MNKTDIIKLLSSIEILYPLHFKKNRTKKESELFVNVWLKLMADLDSKIVWICLQKWSSVSKFPPTVSDLRKESLEITQNGSEITAIEAWGQVIKAINKYGYYQQEEALNSMDPVVSDVVKDMGFQNLCMSENNMADRAHFLKHFGLYIEKKRKQALLPVPLRRMIAKLADMKALPAPVKNSKVGIQERIHEI